MLAERYGPRRWGIHSMLLSAHFSPTRVPRDLKRGISQSLTFQNRSAGQPGGWLTPDSPEEPQGEFTVPLRCSGPEVQSTPAGTCYPRKAPHPLLALVGSRSCLCLPSNYFYCWPLPCTPAGRMGQAEGA